MGEPRRASVDVVKVTLSWLDHLIDSGYRAVDIAAASGLSKSTIKQVKNRAYNPSLSTCKALRATTELRVQQARRARLRDATHGKI